MKNIFGNNAVSGPNFHGRTKFVKRLANILISGNSFLLLGLRRTGKSSALAEAMRLVREHTDSKEIISLNCQTHRNIGDFYKELHNALPKSMRQKFRDHLKNSQKIPIKIIDFITDHVEEVSVPVVGSVKLRNDIIAYANPIREEITEFFESQEEHIILCIDELPFLFETISKSTRESHILEIESVLTTLRDWRNAEISMAICGSLNLHQQLEELEISRKLLAGLNTQRLPKYTREEAKGLLRALESRFKIGLIPELIEIILDELPDHIPQFIQYYFHILNSTEEVLTPQLVKQLYKEDVYPHLLADFVYQFKERLVVFKGDDYAAIKSMLDHISENEPVTQNNILANVKVENSYALLQKLAEYEFIQQDPRLKYSFSLKLLKQWWLNINR